MNRTARRHDPHAHVIHSPGKRLMQRVPLKFVLKRLAGGGPRNPNASLNLVSFIDFLVVTVIFLLMSFSASGQCPNANIDVPYGQHGMDMLDAPMVSINTNQVLVDGVFAGSTRSLEELGRIEKIGDLFEILKAKRELWTSLQPGNQAFHGNCILQIDQNVPAVVVKSVFKTAALAGYPNVNFMVRKLAN